ncbi:MAG: S26 family signal peptidase [Euryarchaeota archaeon]|nr:S26 family signal peptidase [Euryarchaeota archaeon]
MSEPKKGEGKGKEKSRKERAKEDIVGFLKDIFIAFVLVVIVLGALVAYSGVWPPVVVIESGSMQHSKTESFVGVIDTGDMVLVKKVTQRWEVTPYIEARERGYSQYGASGDVVIYHKLGNRDETPIIHRAVAWVEVNATKCANEHDYANYTFDIPLIQWYGKTYFTIPDYTLQNAPRDAFLVNITLTKIINYHAQMNTVPHSGFVTMGDGNALAQPGTDQSDQGGNGPLCPDLVSMDWIVGKAVGELPWFGLIKLVVTGGLDYPPPSNSWTNLTITIVILIAIPISLDYIYPYGKKWYKARKAAKKGEAATGKGGKRPEEEKGDDKVEEGEDGREK